MKVIEINKGKDGGGPWWNISQNLFVEGHLVTFHKIKKYKLIQTRYLYDS